MKKRPDRRGCRIWSWTAERTAPDTVAITLFRKGEPKLRTLVSPEDLPLLEGRIIRPTKTDDRGITRVVCYDPESQSIFALSRVLYGLQPGQKMDVDHINGDVLDNRRSNLRVATRGQNLNHRVRLGKNNTSGVLGVSFHKGAQRWQAFLAVGGVRVFWQYFDRFEDAVAARKEAERRYLGEWRPTLQE